MKSLVNKTASCCITIRVRKSHDDEEEESKPYLAIGYIFHPDKHTQIANEHILNALEGLGFNNNLQAIA